MNRLIGRALIVLEKRKCDASDFGGGHDSVGDNGDGDDNFTFLFSVLLR